MKRIVLLLVAGSLLATGLFAQIERVDAQAFSRQLETQKEPVLVDVRTPQEFAAGTLEGAVNYNFFAPDFLSKFDRFDKNEPLFIFCRSGNRSGQAAHKLKAKGFKNVIDLAGGYLDWKRTFPNR